MSGAGTRIGERGRLLPGIARQALEERFENLSFDLPGGAWLQQPRACFVTLTANGALRGCVGRLESHRPLLEEVRENAVAAAFHDTRFAPLEARELAGLEIEVSVLSPLEKISAASDAEALVALQPGIDGVVIEAPGRRGTFLPQVWEEISDPSMFLRQLKLKAGLASNGWAPDVRLWRYTVEHWSESDSDLVNAAVKLSLAEDAEDFEDFDRRAAEPNLAFEDVVRDLKQRGKI